MAAAGPADLSISLGPVAAGDVDAPMTRRMRTVPGLFRYECRDGAEIDVELIPGADDMSVADMIAGRVLTVASYQRGLLPLHAGAIATDAGLAAFAGPSGAGKSTLVAAMAARGYAVAGDDMLVVRSDAAPLAAVGARRIKLSPASLEVLGWPADGAPLSNDAEGKMLIAPPHVIADGAGWRPLRAVFELVRREAGFQRLSPLEAAARAGRVIRMPELMAQCGPSADHWKHWLALCAATPMVILGAPDDLDAAPRLADKVAAFLQTELT